MANAPSPTTSVRDGGACEPGTAASVLMIISFFLLGERAKYILLLLFKAIVSDSRTMDTQTSVSSLALLLGGLGLGWIF